MRFIILPIFATALLAGCATTETTAEPQQEKEFVTGSNIPRRDRSGVAVMSREELERRQNASGGPIQRGTEGSPSR